MTRMDSGTAFGSRGSQRHGWLVRRVVDGLILAAGIALALPLILPFG